MKKLFALLLVAGLFTFASCGGGGEKKTGSEADTASAKTDTATAKTPEKTPEEKPAVADTAAKKDSVTVVDTVSKKDGEKKEEEKKGH